MPMKKIHLSKLLIASSQRNKTINFWRAGSRYYYIYPCSSSLSHLCYYFIFKHRKYGNNEDGVYKT